MNILHFSSNLFVYCLFSPEAAEVPPSGKADKEEAMEVEESEAPANTEG